MSMDGLTLLASVAELQQLRGGKIEKIYQPERDSILITVRANGQNHRLLLCVHPENGRIQLTTAPYTNPQDAPPFCMILRKHLHGGTISSITQPHHDRIVHFQMQAQNELGDSLSYTIVTELMGKHSNLILLDASGRILDSIRRIGVQVSSVRSVLPGLPYTPPPDQDKMDPQTASQADFLATLEQSGRINQLLSRQYYGLSPAVAEYLVQSLTGEAQLHAQALPSVTKERLSAALVQFYQQIGEGHAFPMLLLTDDGSPAVVLPFSLSVPEKNRKQFPVISDALDAFYAQRDLQERLRRRYASLQHILQNALERAQHKLTIYEEALSQEEDLEKLRLYGELLSAHIYLLKPGMTTAIVENYYSDPPEPCTIELDARLSPQRNIQAYFKKYQKGKAAKALAASQKADILDDIAYLEGQLDNLGKCTSENEIAEIRQELIEQHYIRPEKNERKALKRPATRSMHFVLDENTDIYVGKNNVQNDALTLHFAFSDDIWMHTKNIPGSHVILRTKNNNPSDHALYTAAMLAAYYSKARSAVSVAVDYCARKYVKKPSGAKPGMVIYTTNRTIYVTPSAEFISTLKTES